MAPIFTVAGCILLFVGLCASIATLHKES